MSRWHLARRWSWMGPLVGAALLLGCAGDARPPSGTSEGSVSGNASGVTPATASRSPGNAPPAARPGASGGIASVQRPSDTGGPIADVKLGKKNFSLATVEMDQQCKKVVAPFDLSGNTVELLSLAARQLGETVTSTLDVAADQAAGTRKNPKASSDKTPPVTTAKQAKHQISATVRHAAMRMNWLPMSLEVLYGETALDKLKAQRMIIDRQSKVGEKHYPAADELLANVLAAVKEPYDYKFQIYLSNNQGDNAMALPGGVLVVDKALVADPTLRDKAWFALSHEVGHVLQRHETRALQARIIDAYSLNSNLTELLKAIRAASNPTVKAVGILGLVTTGRLQFERHFEQQELQADACAVRVLDTAFTDDTKLRNSLQAFVKALPKPEAAKKPVSESDPLAGISGLVDLVTKPIDQHPNSDQRIANLNEVLAALKGPMTPLPAKGRIERSRSPAADTTAGPLR